MPVTTRQLANILPLHLNNYVQHNTTQFVFLMFNNHSTIFQGRHYGITITKTKDKDFTAKINVLGSG